MQRENRLYQADWLLRFYGFTADEVASGGEGGMLALDIDPKSAWALKNRDRFPVDVNKADRELLLRVPGLGTRSVDRILAARRHTTLRLADVARLARSVKRLLPFLITADWRPVKAGDRLDLRGAIADPAALAPVQESVLIAVALDECADLAGFRAAVRRLWARRTPPDEVAWNVAAEADLFGEPAPDAAERELPPVALPRSLGALIETVVCHSDAERYALLYGAVWRVLSGERTARGCERSPGPSPAGDGEVGAARHPQDARLPALPRAARCRGGARFVAWFEPEHFILEAVPRRFFVERFSSMVWSILTPQGGLHWDRTVLRLGPPAQRDEAPAGDRFEAAWRSYYESVFNPARVNPRAMRQHMPAKYWRNLPEAAAIPDLLRAPRRVHEMLEREAAPAKRDPRKAVAAMSEQGPRTLGELNRTIAASPPLTPGADRAVLGEGPVAPPSPSSASSPAITRSVRAGRSSARPANCLIARWQRRASIGPGLLTNAVKHFKYEPRGKKRLHKRPNAGEVKRYRWWLQKEIGFVRPRLVVALGNTALLGLTGEPLSVLKARGPRPLGGFPGFATVHPSYLLRLPEGSPRDAAYGQFARTSRMSPS